MSFNDLHDRNSEFQLKVTEKFLNNEILSADSFDLRKNVLNVDLKKKYFQEVFQEASIFKELDVNFFRKQKHLLDQQVKEILILQELIQERVAEYSAEISVKKMTLNSKMNEIRKKVNILKNKRSASNTYKFVILEDFINAFNINTAKNNLSRLNVDTVAEVATLPIMKRSPVIADKIYISNKSNCVPGNYQTGSNKFIYNLFDNNEETSFECFKEGTGPLTLDIAITFKNESIINKLEIVQQAVDTNGIATLSSLKYRSLDGETYLLKDLVGDQQEFKVSSKNKSLVIYHLPIKAISVGMSISVNDYSTISNLDIYSLGIKKIEFSKIEYNKEGEIYSQTFNVGEGYYFLNIEEQVFPNTKSIQTIQKEISFDNGIEYSLVENEALLDGTSKELIYNLRVKKSAENLRFKTISMKKGYFLNVTSESLLINKNYSPNSYILKNESNTNLKVYQKDLVKRSNDKNNSILLKQVSATGKQEIQLPINVSRIPVEDIEIFCNGVLWEKTVNESDVTVEGKYYIKNNNSIVVFVSRTNSSLLFSMLLKPFMPEVKKEQEGFYLKIDEVFDFDKKNITLTTISSKSDEYQKNINSGIGKYFFEEEYIDPNSFSLKVNIDGSWVESTNYSLNVKEGVIEFTNSEINLEKRATYKNYIVNEVESEKYEIWSKDGEVIGLYLREEDLLLEEIFDDLSETNVELHHLYDGTYSEARSSNNSNKTFVLSSPNIIKGTLKVSDNLFEEEFKEVAFIDGISEHLNIRLISKDYAPKIQKNTLGQVSFSLLNTPYTQGAFSETIKVYKEGIEVSNNRYSITGRVITLTLEENESLSDGYYVSYAYVTEEFEYKTYSVDYKNGIFYTCEDVINPELIKISYKVGRVGVEYSLCKEIKDYNFNEDTREIKIYPEKFLPTNNKVKVFTFQEKNTLSLKDLESYYSPIIYSLKIGLN